MIFTIVKVRWSHKWCVRLMDNDTRNPCGIYRIGPRLNLSGSVLREIAAHHFVCDRVQWKTDDYVEELSAFYFDRKRDCLCFIQDLEPYLTMSLLIEG